MSAFVMVIDDSSTIRKILETCLHRAGYEVKSFQDGAEALRWCGAPVARIPALVLVDVGLPKLDGDGVLDRLKGRLAGAHAYLTKPFKTDEVVAIVQAYLGSLAAEKPAGWKEE